MTNNSWTYFFKVSVNSIRVIVSSEVINQKNSFYIHNIKLAYNIILYIDSSIYSIVNPIIIFSMDSLAKLDHIDYDDNYFNYSLNELSGSIS